MATLGYTGDGGVNDVTFSDAAAPTAGTTRVTISEPGVVAVAMGGCTQKGANEAYCDIGGNDNLDGGPGDGDMVDGGEGDDSFTFYDQSGAGDSFRGGPGSDSIFAFYSGPHPRLVRRRVLVRLELRAIDAAGNRASRWCGACACGSRPGLAPGLVGKREREIGVRVGERQGRPGAARPSRIGARHRLSLTAPRPQKEIA